MYKDNEEARVRLLAIDPSLTCSGWALFCERSETLLGVGKVRSPSSKMCLSLRLAALQRSISALLGSLHLTTADILICEAATSFRDPHGAMKVEQVRTMFEVLARQQGVEVPGRVHPRLIHENLLGARGHQLTRALVKESAVKTVLSLFSDDLRELGFVVEASELARHQDVVDAILVGKYGLSLLHQARRGSIEVAQLLSSRRASY